MPRHMASRWRKGMVFLRAPMNSMAFALRRQLSWSRGVPALRQEDKDGLFAAAAPELAAALERREADLDTRYDLGALRSCSTRADYRENLYLLDALERVCAGLEWSPGRPLRVLDVGARNWNYVFGLHRFFSHHGSRDPRPVELLGLEIDGHGIYQDLHSRADHAQAYVRQLGQPEVRYEVMDFLDYRNDPSSGGPGFDAICLLFPFLTRYALLSWGLPLSCFEPRRLLAHAVALLRPGGRLIVFNQTDRERDLLGAALDGSPCQALEQVSLHSELSPYGAATVDRWGSLYLKPAEVPDPEPADLLACR